MIVSAVPPAVLPRRGETDNTRGVAERAYARLVPTDCVTLGTSQLSETRELRPNMGHVAEAAPAM